MNLVNQLQKLNFSEKEALVFQALVFGGRATVSEISEKSGVNRTTTYLIVESLREKGFVIMNGKDRNSEYIAISRNEFEKIFLQKVKSAENNLLAAQQLGSILGKGIELVHYGYEFAEGEAEIIKTYDKLFGKNCEAEVREICNLNTIPDYLFSEYVSLHNIQTKTKVLRKILFSDTEKAIEFSLRNNEYRRESILVPYEDDFFNPHIIITPKSVVFIDYTNLTVVTNYSEEKNKQMSYMFEVFWKQGEISGEMYK